MKDMSKDYETIYTLTDWMGATVEVGKDAVIWYRGFTGMEGMVTMMLCTGAALVMGPGTIMGVRVGGPWPGAVRSGRRGLPASWGILGIILAALRDLGPGGRPGPMFVPRGDIFCLDFGLGWFGRLPAGAGL